jgi:rod shape-determining protein MreC
MKSSSARTWQTAVLAFIVIGLIALALGGYLSPLTRLILEPFITAQTWLATRFITIQNYLSSPQDLAQLRETNLALEAENARLEAEIIALEQQLSETRILSALVDFARVHPDNRYVAASVIGRDPSPFVKYVIINRGSDDGLRRGMPVVTSQGLAGRVSAVTSGQVRWS